MLGGGERNFANRKFIRNEWSPETCSFFAIDKATTSHLLTPRDPFPPADGQRFPLLWRRMSRVTGQTPAAHQGCSNNCLNGSASFPSSKAVPGHEWATPGHFHPNLSSNSIDASLLSIIFLFLSALQTDSQVLLTQSGARIGFVKINITGKLLCKLMQSKSCYTTQRYFLSKIIIIFFIITFMYYGILGL